MNFELSAELSQEFLSLARVSPNADYEVRQIGTDANMVGLILERIVIGEKTMTYSLPWIAERTGRTAVTKGRYLLVVDSKGLPSLLLQITKVLRLTFSEVSEQHLTNEGKPMRSLNAWKPLHTEVWNYQLSPFGLQVDDDMPVWAEYFDLVYSAQ